MALGVRSALSVTLLIALLLFSATPTLAYDNVTISPEDCSTFKTCGDCVAHLQCGFCVKEDKCVPGGWNAPWHEQTLCGTDKWDYEYGQCFVTHKVVIISLSSAFVGVLLLSCMLCVCCCLCRCCRLRGRDDEERPLLGETPATRHFRRASFYNYNRNRPFERRGRTLSNGTTNGTLGSYSRWRDDYNMYGSYGTPSVMWVGDNCSPPGPVEYPTVGSTANGVGTGDWRSWEKKREELLAKYDKNNES